MNSATFRFYAELNVFLPPEKRAVAFVQPFHQHPSVKDLIESLGVPHPEVDLILVNGNSVDFGYQVHHGDSVSVYPMFEALDITPVLRVRPRPLRETLFVLDIHLGKLAAYLRMLGFDTLYRNDYADDQLAAISQSEGRILLTKDRGLLKRSQVSHGYCVRQTNPRWQLQEIVQRFDLARSMAPFQRCLRCNGRLQSMPKDRVLDKIPPRTQERFEEFHACQQCQQVYWKGSHYEMMRGFIQEGLNHGWSRNNSSGAAV
jgi:uncharacterized protein with PIN domain